MRSKQFYTTHFLYFLFKKSMNNHIKYFINYTTFVLYAEDNKHKK